MVLYLFCSVIVIILSFLLTLWFYFYFSQVCAISTLFNAIFFPCFDRWQEITKCICLKKMKVNPNSSDKIHLRNWCFTPNLSIIVITPSLSLTLRFYPCSSQVCAISPLFNTILPLLWRLTKNKIALSATKSRWLVNSMDKTRS